MGIGDGMGMGCDGNRGWGGMGCWDMGWDR